VPQMAGVSVDKFPGEARSLVGRGFRHEPAGHLGWDRACGSEEGKSVRCPESAVQQVQLQQGRVP